VWFHVISVGTQNALLVNVNTSPHAYIPVSAGLGWSIPFVALLEVISAQLGLEEWITWGNFMAPNWPKLERGSYNWLDQHMRNIAIENEYAGGQLAVRHCNKRTFWDGSTSCFYTVWRLAMLRTCELRCVPVSYHGVKDKFEMKSFRIIYVGQSN